ncbi:MAG: D-alanyl-D-alanine carboxypeptidase family protein [Clostridia bacterium]|nr:D-alanyl-D-alanine carboxypeptidase family protein [Clostridia bacterium]
MKLRFITLFAAAALIFTSFSGCRLGGLIEAFDPSVSPAPKQTEYAITELPSEAPAEESPAASDPVSPAPTFPSDPAFTLSPGQTAGPSSQAPAPTPAPTGASSTQRPTPGPSSGSTEKPTARPTVTPKPAIETQPPEPVPTNGWLTEWERTRLINFAHRLADDYVPHDLINTANFMGSLCEYHNLAGRIQTEVAVQAKKMFQAACSEGVGKYYIQCAYRRQESQWALWLDRLSQDPHYGDDPYTRPVGTMPGNASEHCAGLAMDITSVSHKAMDAAFGNTAEGIWLKNNSYRFGFVLRYPAGKAHLTGVHYESWHFRYVGVELAYELHRRGICLEEYYSEYQPPIPAPTETPHPTSTPTPTPRPTTAPTTAPTSAPSTPAPTQSSAPTLAPQPTPSPAPTPTPAPTETPSPAPANTPEPAPTEPPPEPTEAP